MSLAFYFRWKKDFCFNAAKKKGFTVTDLFSCSIKGRMDYIYLVMSAMRL